MSTPATRIRADAIALAAGSDHRTCPPGGNCATHAAHHPAGWRIPT